MTLATRREVIGHQRDPNGEDRGTGVERPKRRAALEAAVNYIDLSGSTSGTDRCRSRRRSVYDEGELWDTVDALIEVVGEHGVSAAQVASAWLFSSSPAVTSLNEKRTTRSEQHPPGLFCLIDQIGRPVP